MLGHIAIVDQTIKKKFHCKFFEFLVIKYLSPYLTTPGIDSQPGGQVPIWLTSPPGYLSWQNRFLGIDSWSSKRSQIRYLPDPTGCRIRSRIQPFKTDRMQVQTEFKSNTSLRFIFFTLWCKSVPISQRRRKRFKNGNRQIRIRILLCRSPPHEPNYGSAITKFKRYHTESSFKLNKRGQETLHSRTSHKKFVVIAIIFWGIIALCIPGATGHCPVEAGGRRSWHRWGQCSPVRPGGAAAAPGPPGRSCSRGSARPSPRGTAPAQRTTAVGHRTFYYPE